jgi:hypothetical protein
LRWWLELNHQIGYSKLSFCSNEIDLLSLFGHGHKLSSDLILQFNVSNFIEVESLDCLPNFFTDSESESEEFLPSYRTLGYRGSFSNYMTDMFNIILTNSCYMKNFNKYSHITVVDNDETVIPRAQVATLEHDYYENLKVLARSVKSSNDLIDDIEEKVQCTNINEYLTNLNDIYKSRTNKVLSYYFQQAYYFDMNLMQSILNELELKINRLRAVNRTLVNVASNIASVSFNYTFLISDEYDLAYAKDLLNLNKKIVKPYLSHSFAGDGVSKKLSDNYSRFFFILSERDMQYASGKTIHSTRFNNTRVAALTNICIHSLCRKRASVVQVKHGFLSHFRKSVHFDMKKENKANLVFKIRQLRFDFNYFNCFVKPILAKYKSGTIKV